MDRTRDYHEALDRVARVADRTLAARLKAFDIWQIHALENDLAEAQRALANARDRCASRVHERATNRQVGE